MNVRVFFFALLAGGLTVSARAAFDQPYSPMKIVQTEPAIFPRQVLELGITSGEVQVSLQVDDAGKLVDYLVTSYTHPKFADSAVAALKRWDYEPAYLNGHARSATIDLTFAFNSEGVVVVSLSGGSAVDLFTSSLRANADSFRACTLRQLDRIPTPKKVVQPVYTGRALKEPHKITVMFFIDQEGRVRLPAVSRATNEANEALSAAAVEAVSQWQFEPPLSRGLPVLVEARQDFTFHPPR